jgi:hypothetical protein
MAPGRAPGLRSQPVPLPAPFRCRPPRERLTSSAAAAPASAGLISWVGLRVWVVTWLVGRREGGASKCGLDQLGGGPSRGYGAPSPGYGARRFRGNAEPREPAGAPDGGDAGCLCSGWRRQLPSCRITAFHCCRTWCVDFPECRISLGFSVLRHRETRTFTMMLSGELGARCGMKSTGELGAGMTCESHVLTFLRVCLVESRQWKGTDNGGNRRAGARRRARGAGHEHGKADSR